MKIKENVKHDRLNNKYYINQLTNIVIYVVFKIDLLTNWHSLFSHVAYLATKLEVSFCKLTLGNSTPKKSKHSLIKLEFDERKIFMQKRVAVKSIELISLLLSGQASSPYSNIGKHLLFTRCNVTSSEAAFATLPNKEFAER